MTSLYRYDVITKLNVYTWVKHVLCRSIEHEYGIMRVYLDLLMYVSVK